MDTKIVLTGPEAEYDKAMDSGPRQIRIECVPYHTCGKRC